MVKGFSAIYPRRDVTGQFSQDLCGSVRLQGGESVAQAGRQAGRKADIDLQEEPGTHGCVRGTCTSLSARGEPKLRSSQRRIVHLGKEYDSPWEV